MTDGSFPENSPQWDPDLVEFVVEMVTFDKKVMNGDEDGLQEANSILKEAASLQRSIKD
jgi:hypothetical protein